MEDKPTERGRILRQVWRTDELETAGALAGAARQEAAALRVRLDEAASAFPEDPAAHLAQLKAERNRAREHAGAATATAGKAETTCRTLQDANRARAGAEAVIERLRASAIDRAAKQVEPIAAREREVAAQDAALVQQQTVVATRLAEVPDDTDGPDVTVVASALATLPAIGPLVTAAETTAESARGSARRGKAGGGACGTDVRAFRSG